MSIQSLHTAATGVQAMQLRLEVIAHNLANSSTTGFKRTRADFEDIFYRQLQFPGLIDQAGNLTGTGIAVGLGTRLSATQVDFREGNLQTTEKPLDIAITGKGFFQVQDDSRTLYTRAGAFTRNATGQVVLASAGRGRLLEPPITIPDDATRIDISQGGIVSVEQAGSGVLTQVGTIQLARFINPEGLVPVGENLFAETEASGPAILGDPGLDGFGALRQGFLEMSNVEPVTELVDLITTQRSFELNSQVIQAADQNLQLIATLRRF